MSNWYYESDGGYRGPVTHYLTNEDHDRLDFDSKEEALDKLEELTKVPDSIVASPKCIAWIKKHYENPRLDGLLNLPSGTSLELIEDKYTPVYKDGRHEGLVFLKGALAATITFPVECSLEKINDEG